MRMPGFSAEASLHGRSELYRMNSERTNDTNSAVVPAISELGNILPKQICFKKQVCNHKICNSVTGNCIWMCHDEIRCHESAIT
jgi:hypothetical protein